MHVISGANELNLVQAREYIHDSCHMGTSRSRIKVSTPKPTSVGRSVKACSTDKITHLDAISGMYSIASSRKHPVMVKRQPMQMTTAEARTP